MSTEDPSGKRLEQAEQNGDLTPPSEPKRLPPAQTSCRCGAAFRKDGRCARGHHAPANTLRFKPGNKMQLRHGAYSRSGIQPAYEAIDEALGRGPGSEPRYQLARQRAASALARLKLLEAYVDANGMLDKRGSLRPAFQALLKADEAVRRWMAALGLDPSSAGRLGVSLTAVVKSDFARRMEQTLDREMGT